MTKGRSGGRRTRTKLPAARRILVVTEGKQTEPQYVEGLNSYLRSKNSTTSVKSVGVGRDPLNVVKACVKHRNSVANSHKAYDICVCLVDVDQHTTLDAAAKLAEEEDILLLVSNIKFEIWLKWHRDNGRPALTSSQLDSFVKREKLVDNKNLTSSFPYSNVHDACATAKQADPGMKSGRKGPNPSSSLPILIDRILGI